MHARAAAPESAPRRHGRRVAVPALVALLLHAAGLSGLDWAWPEREVARVPSAAMQVWTVALAPPPVSAARPQTDEARTADARTAVTPPPTRFAPVASVRAAPVALAARVRNAALPASAPARLPGVAPTPAAPIEATASEPRAAEPQAAPAQAPATDDAIPLYATQLPPAARLRFELRRGPQQGHAELAWRPQAQRYELRFEARTEPRTVLAQASDGGFDAAGLAPLRHTEQRGRRAVQAANFQRAGGSGKLTFSGPAVEFGLQPGMQDRLSWMTQLAAIAAAEPAPREAGAKIALRVAGVHGEVSVWVFRGLGADVVETSAGTVDSIGFRREPLDPYDTTVQVWLDPARHWLPVRARIKAGPGDPGLGLVLQELEILPTE